MPKHINSNLLISAYWKVSKITACNYNNNKLFISISINFRNQIGQFHELNFPCNKDKAIE